MKLSKQDILDKVWQWFIIERNPQAVIRDEYGGKACRYRMDETPECQQRCAIGIFIPDELYTPLVESQVDALLCGGNSDRRKVVDHLFSIIDFEIPDMKHFLRNLQATHDMARSLEDFETKLIELASQYNLIGPDKRN